jgi:hypothetical protein
LKNSSCPRSPTRSPHQLTCGEKDTHRGGVLGDGENVNLEMKKKRKSKILRLVYNADGR